MHVCIRVVVVINRAAGSLLFFHNTEHRTYPRIPLPPQEPLAQRVLAEEAQPIGQALVSQQEQLGDQVLHRLRLVLPARLQPLGTDGVQRRPLARVGVRQKRPEGRGAPVRQRHLLHSRRRRHTTTAAAPAKALAEAAFKHGAELVAARGEDAAVRGHPHRVRSSSSSSNSSVRVSVAAACGEQEDDVVGGGLAVVGVEQPLEVGHEAARACVHVCG